MRASWKGSIHSCAIGGMDSFFVGTIKGETTHLSISTKEPGWVRPISLVSHVGFFHQWIRSRFCCSRSLLLGQGTVSFELGGTDPIYFRMYIYNMCQ